MTAAAREANEEAGIDAGAIEVVDVFTDDHGNWRYDTVIAHVHGDAGAHEANMESDEVRWVPLREVSSYDLHPGLARSWAELHVRVAAGLT